MKWLCVIEFIFINFWIISHELLIAGIDNQNIEDAIGDYTLAALE